MPQREYPIRLDFRLAGGRPFSQSAALFAALKKARRANPSFAYAELPYRERAVLEPVRRALRHAGRFDAILLLGIGGSALGARALVSALGPVRKPFRVMDNVDPDAAHEALEGLNLKNTLLCAVSKSGNTAETLAAFLFVLEESRRRRQPLHPCRVAVVTSETASGLGLLARKEGYGLLEIPKNVGGRFSVLSAAGLLPCAAAGLDVNRLLMGARRTADLLWSDRGNPALRAAFWARHAARSGKTVQVVMPYADRLLGMAAWYAQLWAESLGKKRNRRGRLVRAGQTPVVARGASDQHSQLQLYREGPRDKAAFMWELEGFRRRARMGKFFTGVPSFSLLGGKPMEKLLRAEAEATALGLARSGCPVLRLRIPRVDAFHMGALMYFLEHQTVAAAELWGINAFDQPGVEFGKKAARAFMRRAG